MRVTELSLPAEAALHGGLYEAAGGRLLGVSMHHRISPPLFMLECEMGCVLHKSFVIYSSH